jgi:hypothetical protein
MPFENGLSVRFGSDDSGTPGSASLELDRVLLAPSRLSVAPVCFALPKN